MVAPLLLVYWIGYTAIVIASGALTSSTIPNEVWQLTAWGLLSSLGLVFLGRFMIRVEGGAASMVKWAFNAGSLKRCSFGFLLGAASFGLHLIVVTTLAGPVRIELVPGVGATTCLLYFGRFLATSCMEELGFRGYPLKRLKAKIGPLPAVILTAVVFGLSHLLYGWDWKTIAVGVVPPGIMWGMSAVATRGVAVPIGLHAAWNFAGWSAGSRAETGPLRMVFEGNDLEQGQTVGTASYLATFAVLTLVFWWIHRQNVNRHALETVGTAPPL